MGLSRDVKRVACLWSSGHFQRVKLRVNDPIWKTIDQLFLGSLNFITFSGTKVVLAELTFQSQMFLVSPPTFWAITRLSLCSCALSVAFCTKKVLESFSRVNTKVVEMKWTEEGFAKIVENQR